MRAILYTFCFVAIVAGPFWIAGQHRAAGEIPAEFRSEVAPEVLTWELKLGTREILEGRLVERQLPSMLGPLSPRVDVDMAAMQLLGAPSDRFMATAPRSDNGTRAIAYPGLGLQLDGFGEFHPRGTSGPSQAKRAEGKLLRIILGNPWAMSADDPIVRACSFKLPNGIAFGMGIEEVERRLREISPALVPGSYKEGYTSWQSLGDGTTVTLSCGTFRYMGNQLVAIVLE